MAYQAAELEYASISQVLTYCGYLCHPPDTTWDFLKTDVYNKIFTILSAPQIKLLSSNLGHNLSYLSSEQEESLKILAFNTINRAKRKIEAEETYELTSKYNSGYRSNISRNKDVILPPIPRPTKANLKNSAYFKEIKIKRD